MSLLTGIVLIFLGGWLKKNKRNRKGYLTLFAAGGVFTVLSAVLSVGGVSGYVFLLSPFFIAVGCLVVFVEALFIWRLSTHTAEKKS